MTLTISSLDSIEQAAQEFLSINADARWFAFNGDMGAGKTTFIRALCKVLGVEETVTSPSFAIVNEYQITHPASATAPHRVFHFDFYRLRTTDDVLSLGIDEYFTDDAYCFMEWPQIAEAFLPEETVLVSITYDETTQARTLIW
ncbi:MAG: tRNA (adenosine(37)-N6)-threonylcarbamoyltransferase complex ATPase subunit type 1 TsaE [Bacteroidaceae bacterium]|nr:tRNA (adenosine(37)-N6)-threonylcarbamoyltransferase complex ATPase subunit type 1 TsaE [Bacteroidaceae bacterium]